MNYLCAMNELSLFIEYLLLSNDSVTIPGIGTLVAKPHESVYDAKDETLLPPYRQVVFCKEEKGERCSVLEDIRKVYGSTQEEAERKLSVWLTEFFQSLTDYGCVDFGSVGTFANVNGQLSFHPTLSGITTPEYYALDVLQIRQINETKTASNPIIKSDGKNITIRINKNVITYVAAACVALLLFFSSGIKVFNSDSTSKGLKDAMAFFLPKNLMTSIEEPASMDESPSTANTQTQTAPSQSPAPKVAKQEAEGRYCIVLASAISRHNAEEYVKSLKGQGFESARILEGSMIRVVIGNYQTDQEAYSAVREVQKSGGDFQYAWVYEIKTR